MAGSRRRLLVDSGAFGFFPRAAVSALTCSLVGIWRQMQAWRGRRLDRVRLATMSDRMLKDIGMTRVEARREAAKWFWQK